MINTLTSNTAALANLSGVFQLDETGTIIYCRAEPKAENTPVGFVGQNFFDCFDFFDNAADFRRCVKSFWQNRRTVDSFDFSCRVGTDALPVKVLMVRLYARTETTSKDSILLDVRNAEINARGV